MTSAPFFKARSAKGLADLLLLAEFGAQKLEPCVGTEAAEFKIDVCGSANVMRQVNNDRRRLAGESSELSCGGPQGRSGELVKDRAVWASGELVEDPGRRRPTSGRPRGCRLPPRG